MPKPPPNIAPRRNRPRLADFDDPQVRERAIRYIRNARGWYWVLLDRARNIRSLRANAYYHGVVVPAVRDALNETQGNQLNDEDTHELLKREFLPMRKVRIGNKVKLVTGSTRRLSVTEFGEYVEKCKMLAETLSGQPVPDPRQHK